VRYVAQTAGGISAPWTHNVEIKRNSAAKDTNVLR
jgi:hypothetical protein